MDSLIITLLFLKKALTVFFPGLIASILGFIFFYPKTVHEAMLRFFVTIIFSIFIGPISLTIVHAFLPSLFESAEILANSNTIIWADNFLNMPILILASMPGWWITGAICRFWEKKKDKDIGQILEDILILKDKVMSKDNGNNQEDIK